MDTIILYSTSSSDNMDRVAGIYSELKHLAAVFQLIVEDGTNIDSVPRSIAVHSTTADSVMDAVLERLDRISDNMVGVGRVLVMSVRAFITDGGADALQRSLHGHPMFETARGQIHRFDSNTWSALPRPVAAGPVGHGFLTMDQDLSASKGFNGTIWENQDERNHDLRRAGISRTARSPAAILDAACFVVDLAEWSSGDFYLTPEFLVPMSHAHAVWVAEGAIAAVEKRDIDPTRYRHALVVTIPTNKRLVFVVNTDGASPADIHMTVDSIPTQHEAFIIRPSTSNPIGSTTATEIAIGASPDAREYWREAMRATYEKIEQAQPLKNFDTWIVALNAGELLTSSGMSIDDLMSNPFAQVRGYDFEILSSFIDAEHFRDSPAWRRSEIRMWRARSDDMFPENYQPGIFSGYAPVLPGESVRVTNNRIIDHGTSSPRRAMDRRAFYLKAAGGVHPNPDAAGSPLWEHLQNENNMVISARGRKTTINIHMLAYAGEDPVNVIRWRDLTSGLASQFVLGWTEPRMPGTNSEWSPSIMADVGIDMIHAPLNAGNGRHFAQARNKAINAIRSAVGDFGWAVFFDPDERFVGDANDALRSLRRMAEANGRWGYMFQAINPTRTGMHVSESIRMIKLDPAGLMKMSGRVHESFSGVLRSIQHAGINPDIQMAPFRIINQGLNGTEKEHDEKLARYKELLELELEENPNNVNAMVALAAQLRHEGDLRGALEMLERADVLAGPDAILIRRELAAWHASQALGYQTEIVRSLPNGHSQAEITKPVVRALRELLPPDFPHLGEVKKITE